MEMLMPLVRISLMRGKPPGFAQKIGATVYQTMVDTINVPSGDNFQVITEHDRDHLVYDAGYLAVSRTDGVVFIQITLNEGRSVELKKMFYRTLAERLHHELGIRMEDVFINLVEVTKENWSFGNGVAQYSG
jgi:phenylpyruvate tautomerase PptA (4-oxalocrotonate tautomerase family)